MGTNFYSIENNITPQKGEFILADTNIILDLVGKNRPPWRVIQVQNFFKELAKNDNLLLTTVKTWEELAIIIQSENLPKTKKELRNNYNTFNIANDQLEQIKTLFNSLPNVYDEPIGAINNDILPKIQANCLKHKLKWPDSTIYTIGIENSISNFWSSDGDWTTVQNNNINIFLDSRSFRFTKISNNSINPTKLNTNITAI